MIYDYLKIIHTNTFVIVDICSCIPTYSTRYCKLIIASEDSAQWLQAALLITHWVVRLKCLPKCVKFNKLKSYMIYR